MSETDQHRHTDTGSHITIAHCSNCASELWPLNSMLSNKMLCLLCTSYISPRRTHSEDPTSTGIPPMCDSDSVIMYPRIVESVLLLFLYLLSTWYKSRRLCLPPGPSGLPLIGSLHLISDDYQQDTFSEWARKYGE